jgi:cytochrome c-type biogenesis protein CcmE
MRGRQIRLVVSLVVASLLATVFVYTAITDDTTRVFQIGEVARQPDLAASETVRLNGRVWNVQGDALADGGMVFALEDNEHRPGCVRVRYRGSVPEAFREGRAVLVDGKLVDGVFVAEPGSLSTKCPSKYESEPAALTTRSPSCA